MKSANDTNRRSITAIVIAGGIAVGLFAAPEQYTNQVRVLMRDVVHPGLIAFHNLHETTRDAMIAWISPPPDQPEVTTGEATIDATTLRRLQIENATLQQRLQQQSQQGSTPYRGTPATPLLVADLLGVRVLGEEAAGLLRGGLLLDRGGNAAIAESDLVLRDESPLLDAGNVERLEPGFAVFAGRTVIGRVHHVGRWTSSIEPVTAQTFRAGAQLIRKSPTGFAFGATGVLKGTGGPTCRLDMIPVTEPVSVGDGVYTVSGGDFPFPMYYGKVTRAVTVSGAAHWEIDVEPVALTSRPDKVHVLRRRLNPERNPRESSPQPASVVLQP